MPDFNRVSKTVSGVENPVCFAHRSDFDFSLHFRAHRERKFHTSRSISVGLMVVSLSQAFDFLLIGRPATLELRQVQ
jgi:hypothetical protein